jgi:hypothetical protein
MLLVYWGTAVSAVREKSVTYDELACLTAGCSAWLTNDFRLQPENGTFEQRWAAVPVVLAGYGLPSLEQPAWYQSDVWIVGDQFFYATTHDADHMLWLGRAAVAVLGMLLGLLVFFWSKSWFGWKGGLISLCAFVFCPTALAHGSLVTSDMAAAFFFLAAVGALWRAFQQITVLNLTVSGLATSGLFLAKNSALLSVPIALALVTVQLLSSRPVIWGWRSEKVIPSRGKRCLVLTGVLVFHALVLWGALWAAYGFRYSAFAHAIPGRDRLLQDWALLLQDGGWLSRAVAWARDHQLLPEAYLYGLAHTEYFARSRNAFWNGHFSTEGWVGFFPYCLLAKTPLSFFCLLGLAGWALVCGWRAAASSTGWKSQVTASFYRGAPLWILLAVYWAFALAGHLNIGHRHLLPTYPAMYIWAGGAATFLSRGIRLNDAAKASQRLVSDPSVPQRLMRIVTLGLVSLMALESLLTWPHYLAYFNAVGGGPRNGYRHLVDSSLDWGQDLPGLKKWLQAQNRSRPGTVPVYLAYFGTARPEYYGIQAIAMPSLPDRREVRQLQQLRPGVYCVSATMLQGVYLGCPGPWNQGYESRYRKLSQFLAQLDDASIRRTVLERSNPGKLAEICEEFDQLRFARLCAFLRRREPDEQIGYSILIYRIRDEDLNQALGTGTGSAR